MLQQPANPPPEPGSKEFHALIDSAQKVAATAVHTQDKLLEVLKDGVKRIKLLNLVLDIERLKNDIKTIEELGRLGNRKPEVDSLLGDLASKKEELAAFLKEEDLDAPYDTLVRDLLKPKRWWQFWRRHSV